MPKITFISTGDSFDVPDGTSFVEFCQANDSPHDFGCTVGSCGMCRAVLEQGADNVNPITEDEQDTLDMVTEEKGARLGCQLKIAGDISIRAAQDVDEH